MTGIIQGRDVLIQFHDGSAYLDFGCAKELSLATSTALVLTTTVGDGHFDKYEGQSVGYSISLTAVTRFDDTQFSAFQIWEYQVNMLPLKYRIFFTDEKNDNQKIVYGNSLVESSTLSGNVGQVSAADFSLRGSGRPNITDDITEIEPPTTFTAEWGWETLNLWPSLHGHFADLWIPKDSGTFPKTTSVIADFTPAPPYRYLIMREPISEPAKSIWFNVPVFNQGHMPDSIWYAPFISGANRYYVTRMPVSFDPTQNTMFS